FIHYGEQALHNTEKFFSFVKDHAKDVVLLWMWYPNNPKNSEGNTVSVPLLEQLLEKYKEEDWVIYDDTANIQRGSVLCDGYYGDPCFGGHKCEILGKSVAYMNYEAVENSTDENDEIELMQEFYADVLNYKIDNNEQEYCVGKKIWDEIKI
ncbi:MAG: hypothetical protein K2H07_08530, partial [Lachnospiraceae bacterium]|nr:hypothetical protein [Lachnospiraceae bacterium]